MCGIVALLSRRDPIKLDVVEKATQRLHHRGPDGHRFWISEDRKVALGHARLSIIDLRTGEQPIASESWKPTVTGCGRDPIARSLSISMKIWGRTACIGCMVSSRS